MSSIKIVRSRSTDEDVRMAEQVLDDRGLYQSMKDGRYAFATGDLTFMGGVGKYHDAQLHLRF